MIMLILDLYFITMFLDELEPPTPERTIIYYVYHDRS